MPPLLKDLLRTASDGSARTGFVVGLAVLAELCVITGPGGGPWVALVLLPLAVSVVWWRARPSLALALAGTSLVLAILVSVVFRDPGVPAAPFLLIVVPIAGGAISARRGERTAAAAIAGAFAVLVTLWAMWTDQIYVKPAIAISAALVAGMPFVVAWLWDRADVRSSVTRFARAEVADLEGRPPRFWWTVAAIAAFSVTCVALDLPQGQFGTVLSAAAIGAGLVWCREKPATGLAASAVGLLIIGILEPFYDHLGGGSGLLLVAAAVPVFLSALGRDPILIRYSVLLVVATALVGSALSGTLAFGLVVLVIGGVVFVAAWLVLQLTTTKGLRIRLRESERRGRVAERGVQIEQERTRIAREVHDVVAHSLAVVIAQADGARFAAESKPTSVAPALEAIADTARAALGEVRTMLHDLRTVGGDGVVAGPKDIDAVLETVRAIGIEVDSVVFGRPRRTTEDAGLAMFRIAQEAMTNALRHGDRTDPIAVEIDWGEQEVVLVVTNGVPVDAVPATERAGHGIPGMIERAALVGGECTAGVGSNGRFRVRATLPVLPTPDPAAEDDVADAIAKLFAVGPRAA